MKNVVFGGSSGETRGAYEDIRNDHRSIGVLYCVINYVRSGVSIYNKKHGIDRFVSAIPLVSGILMFASAAILLPEEVRALGFLAFLLGHTYPLLVYSAIVTRLFTRDPKIIFRRKRK